MTGQLIACRWMIDGDVQGVGFRWSTQAEARALGVSGWVRNLPHGRVEVVAKGTPDQIGVMDAFLRTGPRPARVDNVEKASIPHQAVDSNSFTIK